MVRIDDPSSGWSKSGGMLQNMPNNSFQPDFQGYLMEHGSDPMDSRFAPWIVASLQGSWGPFRGPLVILVAIFINFYGYLKGYFGYLSKK